MTGTFVNASIFYYVTKNPFNESIIKPVVQCCKPYIYRGI